MVFQMSLLENVAENFGPGLQENLVFGERRVHAG
jgi:hypothetical protein